MWLKMSLWTLWKTCDHFFRFVMVVIQLMVDTVFSYFKKKRTNSRAFIRFWGADFGLSKLKQKIFEEKWFGEFPLRKKYTQTINCVLCKFLFILISFNHLIFFLIGIKKVLTRISIFISFLILKSEVVTRHHLEREGKKSKWPFVFFRSSPYRQAQRR